MNIEPAPAEYQRALSFSDAKLYCFALIIDGKTGWRLPTMIELHDLYRETNDFMWCLAYCEIDRDYPNFDRLCWPVRDMGD